MRVGSLFSAMIELAHKHLDSKVGRPNQLVSLVPSCQPPGLENLEGSPDPLVKLYALKHSVYITVFKLTCLKQC